MTLRPLLLVSLTSLLACMAPEDDGPVVGRTVQAIGAGTFSEVTNFGGNDGGLKMFKYVPSPAPAANAPLVVAMHACTQTANNYQDSGWNELADRWGFYVLYPEQQPANNQLRCFNWGGEFSDPTNIMRNQGENLSIKNMIEKMKADHSIDAARIFVMGHSGGGANTTLMMATHPEVFAGAATIAGIPYNCTTTFTEVSGCLSPGRDRTPTEWGDRVRAAYPGYAGPYPKLSIWHGTSDFTVNTMNAREILEQWSNVHGIDTTADATDTVDGHTRTRFQNAGGQVVIERWDVQGMGHGTPVEPSAMCGVTGGYFLDANVCAVARIGEFWGLDGAAQPTDTTPPTVNVTAPATGATVSGNVNIQITANDNVAVTEVELFINGQAKANFTSPPYTFAWDTGAEANGQYNIRAVASDAAGNSAADDDTTVTVSGGVSDTTPPTVSFTAPGEGATVSGQVPVSIDATDNFGVARVELLVDGTSVSQATAPPYNFSWDASQVAAGSHTLTAKAVDGAGNEGSATRTVTVEAGAPVDTTPPVVSFAAPASSGTTVSGLYKVVVNATDNVGVNYVFLFLGSDLIGSDYVAPYEFLWDTAVFPEGPSQLVARGFDLAGNLNVAMIDVTVIRVTPEPEPERTVQRVPAGRKTWGCSSLPAPGELGGELLLLSTLFLFFRRRSSKEV